MATCLFFFYLSCQRFFDAVTVEGLSLFIVQGLLTVVLPNQGFLVLISDYFGSGLQINVYRERRALALSLSDTKTAVNKLHRIINVVLTLVVIVIWLLILGIATTQLLVFISSQMLLVVFVFGNTCKTVFEAIIFLFVMHPFDVGDRCLIDGVQVPKLIISH